MPDTTAALSSALQRVGDRWTLLVVGGLLDGPMRYGELQDAVPGIATNVLTQRLRHLEAERVVLAVPYSVRPRRFWWKGVRLTQREPGIQAHSRRSCVRSAADLGTSKGRGFSAPSCPCISRDSRVGVG